MGDFGYKPRNLHLMDTQLTLDPQIQSMIVDLEAQMAARKLLPDLLNPNWQLLLPDFNLLANDPTSSIFKPLPAGPPSIWSFKPGKGPDTPKAGDISDVTKALYQLPAVQGLVTQAHDEGMRQLRLLRNDWNNTSTGGKVGLVTFGVVWSAALITPIIANQQTRVGAFNLIKGRDIPIPGIDGLSFKVLDKGLGVTTPLGVPGLSGSTRSSGV